MANNYRRRSGDRVDGRRIRSLNGFFNFIPYIMPHRNDACNYYQESFEITNADRWFRQQRLNGYKGIGMLHLFIAAYVRAIAELPALNRFVVGRRVYARNNIEVVLTVKRSLAIDATETTIKVEFDPTDTIFDVYRKMNEEKRRSKPPMRTTARRSLQTSLPRCPASSSASSFGCSRSAITSACCRRICSMSAHSTAR
ncbi:MAG: hypothetical protein ACLU3G_05430 [Christensenellales bacterium]